ncbi:hypothetical protein [Hyphomonas oceanitis]|uniref:hypothetical protein n=1 Tax=Hyphomonas oceanitis TaxID=81033 RepID=UPI0030020B06
MQISSLKYAAILFLSFLPLSACVTNVAAGKPVGVEAETITQAFLVIAVPDYCARTTITPGPFEETRRIESCRADIQFDEDDTKLVLEDRAGLHALNLNGERSKEWQEISAPSVVEYYRQRYLDRAYPASSRQVDEGNSSMVPLGPRERHVSRPLGYSSYPPPDSERTWFGPIAINDDGTLTAWLKPNFDDLDKSVPWQANLIELINAGRTPYFPTNHTIGVFAGDEMVASTEVEIDKHKSPLRASFSLDEELLFIENELPRTNKPTSVYRWKFKDGQPEVVPCATIGGSNRYSATDNCEWAASNTGCAMCEVPNWSIEKIRPSRSGRWAILESHEETRRLRIYDSHQNETLMALDLENARFSVLRGTDIAINSEGSILAYSASDGTIYLFQVG